MPQETLRSACATHGCGVAPCSERRYLRLATFRHFRRERHRSGRHNGAGISRSNSTRAVPPPMTVQCIRACDPSQSVAVLQTCGMARREPFAAPPVERSPLQRPNKTRGYACCPRRVIICAATLSFRKRAKKLSRQSAGGFAIRSRLSGRPGGKSPSTEILS